MTEPTKIVHNNCVEWRLNGKLHREDGPAIEWTNGTKCWFINGQKHNEDGPAVIDYGGAKFWYNYGKLHREDGPAIEYAGGYKEWYLDNTEYTEEEWFKEIIGRWDKPWPN